jgi:hypothetical protein
MLDPCTAPRPYWYIHWNVIAYICQCHVTNKYIIKFIGTDE